jgi:hypothetical protein
MLSAGLSEVKLEENIVRISTANDHENCFLFHRPAQKGGIGRSDKPVHHRTQLGVHLSPLSATELLDLRPYCFTARSLKIADWAGGVRINVVFVRGWAATPTTLGATAYDDTFLLRFTHGPDPTSCCCMAPS